MKSINYKAINWLIYLITFILLYFFLEKLRIIIVLQDIVAALFPFFLAFFIAWFMHPVGLWIAKKTKLSNKFSMVLAIVINIILLLIIIGVIIPLVIYQLISLLTDFEQIIDSALVNIRSIANNLGLSDSAIVEMYNRLYENIRNFILPEGSTGVTFKAFLEFVKANISILSSALSVAVDLITSTGSLIIKVIIAYIMSFYFIGDVKGFTSKLLKLIGGKKYVEHAHVFREISETILAYIRGLILDCTFLFVIEAIGLSIIGVPSAILLAMIAAMFNIIPYVGPIIGGIPIALIAMSQGFDVFLLSLVVVFGSQFIEAYFILPRIMSKVTNLHPVSVIVGLIIFYQLFGFIGMIIATPTIASINVLLKHSKYDIRL